MFVPLDQATATRRRAPRLEFVNGSRCLASLWIVCQHFLPHSSDGVLVKALWRSSCAVDYFIVLSGFVTHWASRGTFAPLSRWGEGRAWLAASGRWYARRFGRVLLPTYLAMARPRRRRRGAPRDQLRAPQALSAVLIALGGGGDVAPGHATRGVARVATRTRLFQGPP